ncbi:unnamed protein product [Adineta steineri]|uniref:Uncharacterized protein n=1 Tax=Adineta steineri TaxID=433720 RepID=A0A815Q2W1_9BILA|nr:unnamed protein product [Adineta steineri]CAF3965211.1 unnamed protein product [Adineta steineri]
MYKTDEQLFDKDEDNYCIYHYTLGYTENFALPQRYLYTYCIRTNGSRLYNYHEQLNINITSISFSDLRKLGITPNELLLWSAPIDIVEDFQIYLTDISRKSSLLDTKRFYNCTWPLFGPICQFQFEIKHSSFDDLTKKALLQIEDDYTNDRHLKKPTSCYTQLPCDYIYPYPLCLDWREVCDGKMHCLNRAPDEENCFELELNECPNPDEYRCHNGAQCISRDFWYEDKAHPDCLDRSDEILDYSPICFGSPSVRCEEHTCRPGPTTLACGDGSCDEFQECKNGRTEQLYIILDKKPTDKSLNDICWQIISCLIGISWHGSCSCLRADTCAELILLHCPPLFRYPSHPIALGHIYSFYTNTQSYVNRLITITLPTYICYEKNFCPVFETSSQLFRPILITLDNRTFYYCHNQSNLPISLMDRTRSWGHFQKAVEKFYAASCLTYGQLYMNITKNCSSYSQLYQCAQSNKCISKHRLLDSIQDCPLGDDEEYEQSCSLINNKYRFQCRINQTLKCISPILYQHTEYDCLTDKINIYNGNDPEKIDANSPISFGTLCDGFEDRDPLIIDEQTVETDETHCDYRIWPCNNTYTHCNGYWNCDNGLDEIDCPSNFAHNSEKHSCKTMEHVCISPFTFAPMCLHISLVNDGVVDCLGASDERQLCRKKYKDLSQRYQCSDDDRCFSPNIICDGLPHCDNHEDEKFCVHILVSKIIYFFVVKFL